MSTKKAIVVPAPMSSLTDIMGTKLTEDNVAGFICDIGDTVEKVGEAYHYAITYMVSVFGHDAVFKLSGNKCKGSTDDSKKKHAVELGLEYPKFQRLYGIFSNISERRADSWRQAKNCYVTIEKKHNEQNTVAAIDKTEAVMQLEVSLEETKAELAAAKAAKKIAEIDLVRAKLEGETEAGILAELERSASDARKEYEAIEQEKKDVASKLQAERDKTKADDEWAAFLTKVDSLAKWCDREGFKHLVSKVNDLKAK